MDILARASIKTVFLIQLFLIFFVTGCGSSGGGGGSSTIDCSIAQPAAICGEDQDGDSLTYSQEVLGWQVAPDSFGLGLGVGGSGSTDAAYDVTSDPDVIDTDGDGLDDYQEFIIKSDPNLADTDGDGLTDYEEINRWGTSPLSIDSDGDSRGPNNDLSPNSLLFDSAELKLDLVNDPNHIPGSGATSPVSDDTDGDGWGDYYEIVESQGTGFNPAIADIPLTKIEIAATPVIRLLGETATESNWNREVAVSDSIGQSVSAESAVTRGTEQIIESTIGVGATFGVEAGFEAGTDSKLTGKVSASISANLSVSASMATSHSVAWTESQSQTAENTYQESLGEGGSEVVTLNGGSVSLPINLVNNGNVSFTLTGLRLNVLARYMNGSSDYTPVLELQRIGDTDLTLGPSQSYPNILMQSDTSDYELIRSFLKNPSGLLFEVSSYTLVNEQGTSFAFAEENIKQKTATVIIDYGSELAPERYLVATSPHRSVGIEGVKMSTVMNDIIEIPYETEAEASGFLSLSSVNAVANDAATHKKWLVTSTSASLDDASLTRFDDIVLAAGDTIYFMYVKDQDSDGLGAREEFLQGTSDMTADSDADGLTDYEEVRESWTVSVEGQLAYNVQSRGYRADSDNNGLNDFFERSCGLDPLRIDTDQDGVTDYDEMYGYDIINGTTQVLKVVPYAGQVILDGGNAVIDTLTAANDDVLAALTPIDQGAVIITAGADGVIDTVPLGDDYVGVHHVALNCEPAGFATNPLDIDTDGESMPDGLEQLIALGSPNNPADIAVYVDTDEDGLSDALETLGFSSQVNGVNVQFTSDPASADSDGDGLPDLLEYMLKSNPSNSDTDSDTLSDFNENDFDSALNSEFEGACALAPGCTIPTTPGANHGTNINHNDTDGDGLNDALDVNGWQVTVDYSAPYQVKPNSALINEDSDLDGLFDLAEYNHRSDPNAWDTDSDGTSDGDELSIYSAWTSSSRNPVQKDRKVTVQYTSLIYAGTCDWSLVWWDSINDLEWLFGVRTPWLNSFIPLNYSANAPEDDLGIGPVSAANNFVADFAIPPFNTGVVLDFIGRYGETFEFYGYVKELDSAAGVLTDWNYMDAGMIFHDNACVDCEQLFMKDTRDNSMMIAETVQLKFTVNATLASTQKEVTASGGCVTTDTLANLNPFAIPNGVSFTVTTDIKVE